MIEISCLPFAYPSRSGHYAIPRKDTRANLASSGLIGKIRLVSDAEEDDIMSEIRSVFASAIVHDLAFPFTLLQKCGPGTKSLTAPSLSLFFSWTAREVIRMAGQGCIYVKAACELVMPKRDHDVAVRFQPVIIYIIMVLNTYF